MAVVYLDPASGVSGDMVLGALIDCGADVAAVNEALGALGVGNLWVETQEVRTGGFRSLRLDVQTDGRRVFRHLPDIEQILAAAPLADRVRERSLAVFRAIAEAEAKVHGVSVDEIHFHEVGAFDSLADIVGTAVALESLAVETLYGGPCAVGTGEIECEHGRLPVPAPATAELLAGWPVRVLNIEGELTTPTGAALLTKLARPGPGVARFRMKKVGCASGHRSYNGFVTLFRAFLGESLAATSSDEMVEVCAAIDDATPEQLGALFEFLPASGAVDVTITPVVMKKNRPGHELRALASPERAEEVARAVFLHSTTFGVRMIPVSRRTLDRRLVPIQTEFGQAQVKEGLLDGAVVTASPEYEDCLTIARARGVSIGRVMRAVMAGYEKAAHR